MFIVLFWNLKYVVSPEEQVVIPAKNKTFQKDKWSSQKDNKSPSKDK